MIFNFNPLKHFHWLVILSQWHCVPFMHEVKTMKHSGYCMWSVCWTWPFPVTPGSRSLDGIIEFTYSLTSLTLTIQSSNGVIDFCKWIKWVFILLKLLWCTQGWWRFNVGGGGGGGGDIILRHFDIGQQCYIIMMDADVLAPNRLQAISNHHADFIMIT